MNSPLASASSNGGKSPGNYASESLRVFGPVGSSGEPPCLGAMTFGEDWGWCSDVKTSQQILDRFIERGGNFIDPANGCTKGHSDSDCEALG
jgi:aryl-alcohol dehydrogenase-like predicted oxidoreductase